MTRPASGIVRHRLAAGQHLAGADRAQPAVGQLASRARRGPAAAGRRRRRSARPARRASTDSSWWPASASEATRNGGRPLWARPRTSPSPAQLPVLLGELEAIVRLAQRVERAFTTADRPSAPRLTARSAETSTQYEAASPRPTRPRSWWSWERPKRSASRMTIIVASGTSTPTSTTVVPTRTSSSPSRKRSIRSSRSRGPHPPVDEADAQRRAATPARSRDLVRSPRATDRGRCSHAGGGSAPVSASTCLLDVRHDDERAVALRGLARDQREAPVGHVPTASQLGGLADAGARSPAARRVRRAGRRRRGRRGGPGRACAGWASRS